MATCISTQNLIRGYIVWNSINNKVFYYTAIFWVNDNVFRSFTINKHFSRVSLDKKYTSIFSSAYGLNKYCSRVFNRCERAGKFYISVI
jgi:hypothetical protein